MKPFLLSLRSLPPFEVYINFETLVTVMPPTSQAASIDTFPISPFIEGDQPRRLYGSCSLSKSNPTFGFTVVYKASTASWSGQYYNEKGEETLLTSWILTSKQECMADSWQAHRYLKLLICFQILKGRVC